MRIALLIAITDTVEDTNYLRLGNELLSRGHEVYGFNTDSLSMFRSRVHATGFQFQYALVEGQEFSAGRNTDLHDFDVVWTLNLGMRHSFLDKVQLLKCLEMDCKLVNSLDALMHFKSKYFLASHSDIFQYPKTFSSSDPDHLESIIRGEGGRWIAKPPAGSLGRDIFLLEASDPNTRVILETMTGPDADQYCLLQPYVEEITQGEKRVLIAGGKPVAQYLRQASGDHRTNVTAGAATELCQLTEKEQSYCERIGQFLSAHGALYVGVDLAFPWVIEFNVVNPGGIQTIVGLGGEDPSSEIISAITPFFI
jgi:glutathione synthase